MMPFEERFAQSPDGLRLFYRDYPGPGGENSARTPVLCIPGLTRNSGDFDFIASHIAATRRVLTTDLRGRGRSDYDPDPRKYAVPVETGDMLQLLETLGIPRIVVLGTSRGGVIAMVMATAKPDLLAGAILNDMGAQLEAKGLERIYNVMRSPPSYGDWDEAAAALALANASLFANVAPERWLRFAHALYHEQEGRIVGNYDPKFPQAILEGAGTNPRNEAGAADLWRWFAALANIPTLLLRGENSELLSADTAAAMVRAKPDLALVTVKDRGHVPFLDEPEAVTAIDAFLQGIA
ncbi:MAG TPA: alpha/beta hydrolase [Micropepsaceae bacterium]|jgi:pimeloyl-ACP methyl ester carboxylesterase|nr:alpha/beta hydrolase [Micropepsaceae bacterium]